MLVFFSDHHFVPDPKHCDVHVENMVERNWICLSLWCPHAENLEVRERLLWQDGEGCQHKHKRQLTLTQGLWEFFLVDLHFTSF